MCIRDRIPWNLLFSSSMEFFIFHRYCYLLKSIIISIPAGNRPASQKKWGDSQWKTIY